MTVAERAPLVSEHEFLAPHACEALIAALARHPELAQDRNPSFPGSFVTYGRAAYLDFCLPRADPQRDYVDAVGHSNRGLASVLGDFLDRLRAKIEELLGEPVAYAPETLALPGVHVFRGFGIRSAGDAGYHFDVQYQRLPLPAPIDPDTPPISVTVPLRNPAHGTGLRVYNVTYDDYLRAYHQGRIAGLDDLVRRKTSAYYPYRVGTLIVHRGLVVHCLTSPGPILATDERITVQCHGIRCGGVWILYW